MNMLEGSIGDKIIKFVIPLALTGILQQLFNAADVMVIGQFAGKNAMAAVGSNAPVINIMICLFIGVSVGANVVIARYIGQNRAEKVKDSVHTSIVFAFFSGLFIAVVGQFVAYPILKAMSVPDEVLSMAVTYLRIYMGGMPVIFLYNFESAIFRSAGDTKTPLIALTISGIINVLLNLFFVIVMQMSVAGVAIATVTANFVSSLLLFIFLRRREGMLKVELGSLKINSDVLKSMLKIGLPAGVQSGVFSLSNLCIQSAINSLGADVMAASSAAFNIEIVIYYIVNAFGQAATTFVGQNYGAGNLKRCRKITRTALLQNIVFTVVASFAILFAGEFLLGLFNSDSAVIGLGLIRLKYILTGEALTSVMETVSGAMRGYGKSMVPAVTTFAGVCGIRIVWVYTVFKTIGSYESLMAVYPLSWAVTALALAVAYFLARPKEEVV
ncbi:MAG: MATE family efflux transporter [Eubacterium sp.]|nr:MATE family efflux transporter [Eubacterium sp.]